MMTTFILLAAAGLFYVLLYERKKDNERYDTLVHHLRWLERTTAKTDYALHALVGESKEYGEDLTERIGAIDRSLAELHHDPPKKPGRVLRGGRFR